MDPWLIVALLFLILGVAGTFIPLVPGAMFSIIGVLTYWWSTGYTEPGLLFVVVALLIGFMAIGVDWLAGAISAKTGGASTKTAAISAVIGILILVFLGPVGMILGVSASVFLIEFYETGEMREGIRISVYTTVGMLASTAVQVLLTLTILMGFLLAIWI